MARRHKQSAAEGLVELIAQFPWWVGTALAAATYWALHSLASQPMPSARTSQEIASLVTGSMWRGLAYGAQFVVPLLFGLGALLSFMKRRERSKLLNDCGTANSSAQALQGMSWQDFEKLVGEGFRRRGYSVQERAGEGADGGVDLVLTKDGEKSFVQCKHWKAFQVGVPVVRELYGVMAAHGASAGFVVTSGRFTHEATAFASGRNIRLIDGATLLQLIRESDSDRNPRPQVAAEGAAPTQLQQPACPKCGGAMVQRIAKRGPAAGSAFLGCCHYPSCRGTRSS